MNRDAEIMAIESTQPSHVLPVLLSHAMIRRHYLPVAERTLFRLIASGKFPKADIGIGGKLRLWKRETIEAWIAQESGARSL